MTDTPRTETLRYICRTTIANSHEAIETACNWHAELERENADLKRQLATAREDMRERCAIAAWNRAMDIYEEPRDYAELRNNYFLIVGAIRSLPTDGEAG